MGRYFHVDRKKSLKENQSIDLEKVEQLGQQIELLNHIDFLFPEGVTSHGKNFINRKMHPFNEESAGIIIEIIYEYVRRSHFPSTPSRFQSMFACDSIEQAIKFRDEFCRKEGFIWEVEADFAFKADMNLLNIGGNLPLISEKAHRYWKQESNENNPKWEYLLSPPVTIIRKID